MLSIYYAINDSFLNDVTSAESGCSILDDEIERKKAPGVTSEKCHFNVLQEDINGEQRQKKYIS